MGGVSASCMTGACVQYSPDEDAPFAKCLDIPSPQNESFAQLERSVSSPNNHLRSPKTEVQQKSLPNESAASTPDSGSQQSVLSTISPTKDRARKNRPLVVEDLEPQSIEGLFLSKLHSEVEIVDRWSDVRSLIRDGDISKLVEYATQNNIDFRSLRIEENHQTALHLAVTHNHSHLVRHFLEEGVNINAKDKDGFTAAALAYKAGSTDIIRILNISKAQEFAGSPYSPYALSIASGAASVRSRRSDAQGETLDALLATPLVTKQQAALDSTPADTLSLPGLPSPVSASDWNTPRSRACSIDVPQNPDTNRLTFNSPASGYRMEMTPPLSFLRSPRSSRQPTPDSVQRRLTLVGQSLDEMEGRQRAFSLPANSPTFEAARARSPTDPPLMLFPSSYSADNTPLEGSSPGSTLTGGDAAAAAAAGGRSRPPLAGKKAHRPITSRLRKAAGRAMALIVPSRGIPPRPSVAATHQTSGAGAGASVGSHARTGSVSSVGSATTQADETTEATEATVSEEARTEAGDEAASGTFHDVHSVSDILMGIALEH